MGNEAPLKLTDEQLRHEIEQGLTQAQIAKKYQVSGSAVSQRVKRLKLSTTAVAVIAPTESRQYVGVQLNLELQLAKTLDRMNLLLDANDVWLRDADNPEVYDIGPRSEEVMVTYWESEENAEDEPVMRKAKAKLSTLLRRIDDKGILTIASETKHADPRENILKTSQEIRQTVTTCVELARLLADAKAMQTLREAILVEIGKVSPESAERIAQAVRRILILHQSAQ
jgi:DNA-binding Lrp family transcriptional regulator